MLSRLKDTLSGKITEQLASELAETKKLQEEQSKITAALKDDIASAATAINELMRQQQNLLKETTGALEGVAGLKRQLEESTASIKVMSSTIQNNLLRKITDEINTLTQEISSKLSGSERLKRDMEEAAASVKTELHALKDEIGKLKTVSSGIRAADFELVKFANQLKAADSEKLRLMGQIDALQRLVSSLRRKMS